MTKKITVLSIIVLLVVLGTVNLHAFVPVTGYWNIYIDNNDDGIYQFHDCFRFYSTGTYSAILGTSPMEVDGGVWFQVDENKMTFHSNNGVNFTYSGTKVGGVITGIVFGWGVGELYLASFYATKTNNPPIAPINPAITAIK